MNKREAIRNHRKLWKWLAENPEADKEEWPGWKMNGGGIDSDHVMELCFLCEHAAYWEIKKRCKNCLGDWKRFGRFKSCCSSDYALYRKWDDHSDNPELRTTLALKIRDVVKAG